MACLTNSGLVLGVENSLMILAHPVSLFLYLNHTVFCFFESNHFFKTQCFDLKVTFEGNKFFDNTTSYLFDLFELVKTYPKWSKLVQIWFKPVFFFETHCFDSEKKIITFENKFGNTTSYLFDDLIQTARPEFLYQKNASEPAL